MPTGTRCMVRLFSSVFRTGFCSTVFDIVERGVSSLLGDCKSDDQTPRSAYVRSRAEGGVGPYDHHLVFSSCSL